MFNTDTVCGKCVHVARYFLYLKQKNAKYNMVTYPSLVAFVLYIVLINLAGAEQFEFIFYLSVSIIIVVITVGNDQ